MSATHGTFANAEKHDGNFGKGPFSHERHSSDDPGHTTIVQPAQNQLHRRLKGRHMQMIAMYVVVVKQVELADTLL